MFEIILFPHAVHRYEDSADAGIRDGEEMRTRCVSIKCIVVRVAPQHRSVSVPPAAIVHY